MLQTTIVSLIVLAAAVYALWYLLPVSLRQRWGRLNRWLNASRGCSACSTCTSCITPPSASPQPDSPSTHSTRPVRWQPPA